MQKVFFKCVCERCMNNFAIHNSWLQSMFNESSEMGRCLATSSMLRVCAYVFVCVFFDAFNETVREQYEALRKDEKACGKDRLYGASAGQLKIQNQTLRYLC